MCKDVLEFSYSFNKFDLMFEEFFGRSISTNFLGKKFLGRYLTKEKIVFKANSCLKQFKGMQDNLV